MLQKGYPRRFPAWLLATLLACDRQSTPTGGADLAALDPYHLPPADTLDPITYEGWKQFRLLCDRCHGEDAEGTTFGPTRLGLDPVKLPGLYQYLHGRSSGQYFGGRPALRRP
jgi:hypothetical protein